MTDIAVGEVLLDVGARHVLESRGVVLGGGPKVTRQYSVALSSCLELRD